MSATMSGDENTYDREGRSLRNRSSHEAIGWRLRRVCGRCRGVAFAAISFYWGIGGTLGLDTLGGSIESLAQAHDRTLLVAVWVTGLGCHKRASRCS